MKKEILGFSAAALALSLAACGKPDQPETNVAAEDMNAMMTLEELPPVAPAANTATEVTVTEARKSEPAAKKPASAKPATAKPEPTPAKPQPEPAAEPKAPDPSCLPEHRAAGHC